MPSSIFSFDVQEPNATDLHIPYSRKQHSKLFHITPFEYNLVRFHSMPGIQALHGFQSFCYHLSYSGFLSAHILILLLLIELLDTVPLLQRIEKEFPKLSLISCSLLLHHFHQFAELTGHGA